MKYVIIGLIWTISVQAKNEITIKEQDLLGGGYEMLVEGKPEVITEDKEATIYSGQSHIMVFADNSKRTQYQKGVRVVYKDGVIAEGDSATEGFVGKERALIYEGVVLLSSTEKGSGGTTSFSCSGGIVHRNGESTGETEVIYRNVLIVSCDRNDNVTTRPRLQIP